MHNAKNTTSKIITKGVLNNKSKALSRSLVKIKENAPKSNGYEKQEALLLSENAEADAIPYLEIDNNDVKCSHSSAVGQIDKDVLFYMMSRGLNESEAKKIKRLISNNMRVKILLIELINDLLSTLFLSANSVTIELCNGPLIPPKRTKKNPGII